MPDDQSRTTDIMTSFDVCIRLRKACDDAGGQSAWAARHAVSPQYVSDVLNARRDPGDSILVSLGLVRMVRYVEKRKASTA